MTIRLLMKRFLHDPNPKVVYVHFCYSLKSASAFVSNSSLFSRKTFSIECRMPFQIISTSRGSKANCPSYLLMNQFDMKNNIQEDFLPMLLMKHVYYAWQTSFAFLCTPVITKLYLPLWNTLLYIKFGLGCNNIGPAHFRVGGQALTDSILLNRTAEIFSMSKLCWNLLSKVLILKIILTGLGNMKLFSVCMIQICPRRIKLWSVTTLNLRLEHLKILHL